MSDFILPPLPGEPEAEVISIEVARHARFSRKCKHLRIAIDPILTSVECRDCGAHVSPVEWIAEAAERWARVRNQYERLTEARKALEDRERTTCQHCGRVTGITRDAKRRLTSLPSPDPQP